MTKLSKKQPEEVEGLIIYNDFQIENELLISMNNTIGYVTCPDSL